VTLFNKFATLKGQNAIQKDMDIQILLAKINFESGRGFNNQKIFIHNLFKGRL
jgi:hypothetical protein